MHKSGTEGGSWHGRCGGIGACVLRGLAATTLIATLGGCRTPKESPVPQSAEAARPGSATTAGGTDANGVFAPVIEGIKKQVQIPVRVPNRLADMGQGSHTVYASVEGARSESYSIILGTEPGCTGGNYCRLGTVAAEKITTGTIPLRGGEKVTLQGGLAGWYFFNECGANCPDNTIVWEQAGVRYTVGIKSGRREELIQMANATLATQ